MHWVFVESSPSSRQITSDRASYLKSWDSGLRAQRGCRRMVKSSSFMLSAPDYAFNRTPVRASYLAIVTRGRPVNLVSLGVTNANWVHRYDCWFLPLSGLG